VGGYQWSDEVRRFGAEEDAMLERGDLAAATELNLRMWVEGPRRARDQVDPRVRARVGEMQLRAFTLARPDAEPRPLVPPAIGRLAEIRVPMLVVVGDQDVADMLAIADLLAGGIAGAQKAVIAGAGHLPSLEQPDRFERTALDFLAQLP
jgi:pimeloyl-ACP methyl ester carboxylesterase